MLFCCFRNTNAAEGSQNEVPAKFSELEREGASLNNDAVGPVTTSQSHNQSSQLTVSDACGQRQPTACESLAQAKVQQAPQDSVMRVVAILQELLGLTSERMQVSRIMALLCQRLSVSWACLTALSADGEVFQHVGSAYLLESRTGTCSFSSCRTNSGLPQGSTHGRGPPSRTSSTNSIAGATAVEVPMSDPHLLRGSDTSIEAAACSNEPLMLRDPGTALAPGLHPAPLSGNLVNQQQQQQQVLHPFWSSSGAGMDLSQPSPNPQLNNPHLNLHVHPHVKHLQQRQQQSYPQSQEQLTGGEVPVTSWPIDWQLLNRERGIRAFACLPVSATNGSGTIIGCLSLGSTEPLDWSKQFWAGSMRLITGWAASAITTTRATARATFYSRLFCATNLDALARAFAFDMPVFLADGAAGPGTALPEIRLALVSSRLQHAVVFAAPLLQVSGRLGLRPMNQGGHAGGGGGGGGAICNLGNGALGLGGPGGLGPLIAFGGCSGPSGSGTSISGLVLGSANSMGTDRGLILGGPVGQSAHTTHPAVAARSGVTASGYDNMDCMVLGTTLDVDDQISGCSSSNSTGGGGVSSARRGGNHSTTGNGADCCRGGTSGDSPGCSTAPEAPPVDCVKISTDSTLLMSVLEAGDIMIIKDALHYFGGGRMVARDLVLNNTRPATAGTLVILPLVHRCRSLGCVYVFARNEFNLTFSRAAWGDMAAMLSRAVFGQLVGKLRHEWYAVLSEDPESHSTQLRGAHCSGNGPGGMGMGRRVRRTTTGNSLCSNASSLRPSFELPSRSVEQAAGLGGSGVNKEAAAALAAAAAVLEYAGFMLPDGDDGPTSAAVTGPTSRSPGTTTVASSPRHRVPAEHAAVGSFCGGSGGGTGSSEPAIATLTGLPAETTTPTATATATEVPVAAGPKAGGESDPPSTSPGSLSFRLPPDVQEQIPEVSVPQVRTAEAAELMATFSQDLQPVIQQAAPSSGTAQRQRKVELGQQVARTLAESESTLDALGPVSQGASETPEALQVALPGISSVIVSAGGGGGGGTANGIVAVSAVMASTVEPMTGITEGGDMEGDEGEEISGSSRELQGWPELVDILYDMHRTRNVSVYLAAYRGQAVAVKMMRSHMSMDGRPGHLESEAHTIAAQQLLSTVQHPNVLRVLMVYPLVYEVVAGKTQRGNSVAHGGGSGGAPGNPPPLHAHGQQQQAPQQQQYSQQQQQQLLQQHHALGRGPLNVIAHGMNDLLSGAGAADVSGVGVYLTAVLPRREKFKRGLALMLELFPSLSLREATQKRMLVAQPDGGGGGSGFGDQLAGPTSYTYVNSQYTMLSDVGHPGTPTSGQATSLGGTIATAVTAGGGHMPPYLPSLPEVASGNDAVFNVDSSPGLAITAASNSGGASAAGLGSGPGGAFPSQSAPPMQLLLSILSQIVAGMTALHSAGLAHGELRPENVLLALVQGGCSQADSGQHDPLTLRTQVEGSTTTPRASPTPTQQRLACGGAGTILSAGGSGGGSVGGGGAGFGGAVSGSRVRNIGMWMSGSSGYGFGGDQERVLRPERPQPGRPITTDVIVKIKDAGMTVVGFSKGNQTVRKLLQRNRSAVLPFLPPEVHRGERYGRSADVYMFGILMWELYTGSVAFGNLAGTPIKLLQTIIADGVRPPWPEGTPVWYQSLASRCWAGNPKQRPSFRRIGDKLADASSAAAAGWGGGGGTLQGVAERL